MLFPLFLAVPWVPSVVARPSPDSLSRTTAPRGSILGQPINEFGGVSLPASSNGRRRVLSKRGSGAAGNLNWWITIGIGSPIQQLSVLPDTGANTFVVQSTLLPPDKRAEQDIYDPSKSSTAKKVDGYTYAQYYTGYSSQGVVYQDTVTLGTSSFSNVYIAVMTNQTSVRPLDRIGNLGLDANFGGQSTSPKTVATFMQSIRSSISQGVAAFNYNTYTLTGQVDIGFINTSLYTGSLVYAPLKPNNTLWVIDVDGMVVNGQLQKIPMVAVVDTGGGKSMIPRAALDAYFSQVPSANYDAGWGTYLFPCNTSLPDMTFSIGGQALRIPKASWLGNPIGSSNTCGSSITPSKDSGTYFGETFIEGAFVVFDYDNKRVGFGNKPAQLTTIPNQPVTGSTYFCTGTNFTGTCQNMGWKTASCNTLKNTPYYHNISAFGPDYGGCTLYSDDGCTAPIADSQNVHYPGRTDAGPSGKTVGSYSCLNPGDYSPVNNGTFNLCNAVGLQGTCQNYNWKSYVCQTVTNSALKNNVSSASPSHGNCYTYTDPNCVNNIQGAAPFTVPGSQRTLFGSQIQSFMCI